MICSKLFHIKILQLDQSSKSFYLVYRSGGSRILEKEGTFFEGRGGDRQKPLFKIHWR
jgi:hypothetical protein